MADYVHADGSPCDIHKENTLTADGRQACQDPEGRTPKTPDEEDEALKNDMIDFMRNTDVRVLEAMAKIDENPRRK